MNKVYKIIMSRGQDIPVDAEEIANILQGVMKKQPVIVRQGIFNPSFFVSIVEDVDRKMGWNRSYGDDKYLPTPSAEKTLPDQFSEIKNDIKKLYGNVQVNGLSTIPHEIH